jgi:hypothetical protein
LSGTDIANPLQFAMVNHVASPPERPSESDSTGFGINELRIAARPKIDGSARPQMPARRLAAKPGGVIWRGVRSGRNAHHNDSARRRDACN